MKRCPQCNRVETDEALKFCRTDGARLVSEPSDLRADVGTAQFAGDADDIHTSLLPYKTQANDLRATGPAAAPQLPAQPTKDHGLQTGRRTTSDISNLQSIVVMPFANIGAESEYEYFSDGLTEELISDLSKVRSLRVISRNSAMRLKGTSKDLRTIASELNVRYVLDGSVRKAGPNLRVSAQLIEADSDANLWSEKYNGTLDDIFEVQESVSRSIVDALKITLSADEERQMAERPIADPRAYDLYLRSRAKFFQGNPTALNTSIELLKQGLQLIGENELLYAALGYSYYFYFRWISKLDENFLHLANECMEKTFALNPSSSHGFSLKGLLSYSQGNIAEAIRSLKQAVALQPDNTEALFWLSINSSYVGDAAQALKYAENVRAIDPLLPSNAVINGVAYIYDGQFDKARQWIERALVMDSTSTIMIWTAAIVDAWCGKTAEAIVHVDKLAQLAPNWVYTQHGLFLKYALLGEKELALNYDSAELTKEAEHDCHFALHVAHCFALIHENQKALDFLELAVRTGMVNHTFLSKFDPLLANLRNDERFKSLMSETEKLAKEVKASL
jgi:non-specific serine/threonine protein kinase